jgi:uncharacterized protein (UPF0333 family)
MQLLAIFESTTLQRSIKAIAKNTKNIKATDNKAQETRKDYTCFSRFLFHYLMPLYSHVPK